MLLNKVRAFAAIAGILLLSSAFAKADQCTEARDTLHRQMLSTVKPFTDRMIEGLFPTDRFDLQRQSCETYRQTLADERRSLELRRAVDRACGSRIHWEKCDTACAAKDLKKSEQKVAYECSPERITEIQQKIEAQKKKEQQDSVDIRNCSRVTFIDKGVAAEPEWSSWIKSCNALGTVVCNSTWLDLEEKGLPTAGLTCPPSKETRTERKRARDENEKRIREENTPEGIRKREASDACTALLMGTTGDRQSLLEKCNSADKIDCESVKQMLVDQQKSTEGIVCRAHY